MDPEAIVVGREVRVYCHQRDPMQPLCLIHRHFISLAAMRMRVAGPESGGAPTQIRPRAHAHLPVNQPAPAVVHTAVHTALPSRADRCVAALAGLPLVFFSLSACRVADERCGRGRRPSSPMDNPYCSCKLTRVAAPCSWRPRTVGSPCTMPRSRRWSRCGTASTAFPWPSTACSLPFLGLPLPVHCLPLAFHCLFTTFL